VKYGKPFASDKAGGVGKTFEWAFLRDLPKQRVILAGGLNASNVIHAQQLGTFAIDVNSGVEESPGNKSNKMMTDLFKQIKTMAFEEQQS